MAYELLTDVLLSPISNKMFGSEFIAAHIFTFVEFFLFSSMFWAIYKEKARTMIFILLSSIFLCVFAFENFIIKNSEFDSLSVGTSNLLLTSNAVICLSQYLKSNKTVNLYSPNFLILASSIIYFSGTLFIYTLFKTYNNSKSFNDIYYLINPIVIFIRNILLLIAAIIKLNSNRKQKIITS